MNNLFILHTIILRDGLESLKTWYACFWIQWRILTVSWPMSAISGCSINILGMHNVLYCEIQPKHTHTHTLPQTIKHVTFLTVVPSVSQLTPQACTSSSFLIFWTKNKLFFTVGICFFWNGHFVFTLSSNLYKNVKVITFFMHFYLITQGSSVTVNMMALIMLNKSGLEKDAV